jgi:hypothetical protein
MPRKPGRKNAVRNVKKAEAAASAKTSRSSAAELTRLIKQLGVERQHHLDSIAEIDSTFKEFGISSGSSPRKGKGGRRKAVEAAAPGPKKGRGRRKGAGKAPKAAKAAKAPKAPKAPKAAKAPKTGTRRSPWASKFSITGDALILGFVKDKGGATTEEIRKHWEGSGRRGKAENNLTQLVKTGQLKRNKLEGKPGSTYTLPS